jgi:hypothetical protein
MDPRSWTRADEDWRRLRRAASEELGAATAEADEITRGAGAVSAAQGIVNTATAPASYLRPLALERVAVSGLMAIADRAYALAASLDGLLETYLEYRECLLEDLDERKTWDEDRERGIVESVTPDGFLTITTADGGGTLGRIWSHDVDPMDIAQ